MTLDELVRLGHYHVAALGHSEETKALIPAFASVLEDLDGALGIDRRAQHALKMANIPALFAEGEMGDAIEHVALLARGADYGETPVYWALFPRGIEAEMPPPEGQSHLVLAMVLRERLVSHPAAIDVKAQVMADFDKAVAKLSAALAARKSAEIEATRARAWAEKMRTEFLAAYERNAVAIANIFPDDQPRQDLYFDERNVDKCLLPGGDDGWPPVGKKGGGKLS
jgi:hypothetical protein